ncbi:MAG: hypothetical protein DA329_01570 [Candidatus Nitrosocosmicus sp.]|jgi:hypothetical protein|nr:hypothetical protein [Candidatus Nitrosocosmicus sp.]
MVNSDVVKGNYFDRLESLFDNGLIDQNAVTQLRKRSLKVYDTVDDLQCPYLSKVIPYVVIGASEEFVSKLTVPYQATSFIAAEAFSSHSGIYAFKLLGLKGGGVTLLTGGSRKLGDNVFASLHRMLVGNNAIIVTVNNMMENHAQIWSWDFFGNHLRPKYPKIYDELLNLSKRFVNLDKFYFVVSIRSLESIAKSRIVELYEKNEIAMLNPKNKLRVIILTTDAVYEHLSKMIKESEFITYLQTGEKFDMHKGLQILRKDYGIKYLLNDGGRKMSESIRDEGLLAEERVTLEPFNAATLKYKIDENCILGKKGWGVDGSELKGSLLLDSIRIGDEKANVYVYPLNESKIKD